MNEDSTRRPSGPRPISPGDAATARLLARASLLGQQVIGIVTEPVLVPAGEEGVLAATQDADLLVIDLSERWRTGGSDRYGSPSP
jgi:hypothetical protein